VKVVSQKRSKKVIEAVVLAQVRWHVCCSTSLKSQECNRRSNRCTTTAVTTS
jgi:hypothetical protein